jgi:hypothetical protein
MRLLRGRLADSAASLCTGLEALPHHHIGSGRGFRDRYPRTAAAVSDQHSAKAGASAPQKRYRANRVRYQPAPSHPDYAVFAGGCIQKDQHREDHDDAWE